MHKVAVSVLAFIVAVGLYVFGIAKSPLPYDVIDRDGSKIISVLELIDARDIGIREHGNCKEYYWLKDGLTAYEECANT